ncbi:MAG: histidinol dehydrogenase [candidate division WOR-3 bacterium]
MRWLNFEDFSRELAREDFDERTTIVQKIIRDVKERGDSALVELTRRFDDPKFRAEDLILKPKPTLSGELARYMDMAAERITSFARATLPCVDPDELPSGTSVRFVPVKRAGIYVPGGRAPYPSSVLMGVIPAVVAGVSEVYVASPPRVNPIIVHAAWLAGAKAIFQVGGAQAIAALAFGTETIPRVDFVAGPGNAYVQEAKRLLWGKIGVDTIAGPSEVCVVADESAEPELIAWELAAQAEHDPDARVYPILMDARLISCVEDHLSQILRQTPRAEITEMALRNSFGLLARDENEAILAVDALGPEHLVLMTRNADALAERIKNAGAIFLGKWSPVASGDYIAGPSHILPTGRWAKFSSGLTPLNFIRIQGVISWKPEDLASAGPPAAAIAKAEGFWAHQKSLEVRIDMLGQQ